MTQENASNLSYLETHPDLPVHEKRSRLDVLSQEIGIMSKEHYDRYKALADSFRSQFRSSISPG